MIENFDLNLSAMSVAGQRKFNAQLRGTRKRVGIVREQNVEAYGGALNVRCRPEFAV